MRSPQTVHKISTCPLLARHVCWFTAQGARQLGMSQPQCQLSLSWGGGASRPWAIVCVFPGTFSGSQASTSTLLRQPWHHAYPCSIFYFHCWTLFFKDFERTMERGGIENNIPSPGSLPKDCSGRSWELLWGLPHVCNTQTLGLLLAAFPWSC